jgi:N-acetylmuramoyl-L-alanine amidase
MGTAGGSKRQSDAFSDRLADALKNSGAEPAFPHRQNGAPKASGATSASGDGGSFESRLQNAARNAQADAEATHAAEAAGMVSPDSDSFSMRLSDLAQGTNGETGQADSDSESETTTEEQEPGGPVGTGDYVVAAGECVSSISKEVGHFWQTIWDDAANTELREARGNPNVLLEGDRVTIPPLEPKYETGATEMRHRFVRLGEPSKLVLQVKDGRGPRGNEPFTLEVDGETIEGCTDPDGKVDCPIPGDAKRGTLTVGTGARRLVYQLNLGGVDPITETTGVQMRLNNLGFKCGSVDGVIAKRTRAAIKSFQGKQDLPKTGDLDEATRNALLSAHGS